MMKKDFHNARMGTQSRLDPAEGEHPGAPFTMGQGYIKVHRCITDWEWYQNERLKSVFLHLLVRCNWQDKRWMGVDVPSGTYITSTTALAEELGLSRSAVVRALERLEKSGEISLKPDSKWTAITLVNWAKYQGEGDQPGQQTDSKRTASEQQTDTTKEGKEGKKERKEEGRESGAIAPTRMKFEEFRAACLKAHSELAVLPDPEAKAFFEYWTEGHANGKGRWQMEKVFDIGRRMGKWKQNNDRRPSSGTTSPKHMTDEQYVQESARVARANYERRLAADAAAKG